MPEGLLGGDLRRKKRSMLEADLNLRIRHKGSVFIVIKRDITEKGNFIVKRERGKGRIMERLIC